MMSLEEWLETSPDHERPVAEKLIDLVGYLPDARIEPVQVGLFIKRSSNFAQLRTMTKWSSFTIKLGREVPRPAPDRKIQRMGSRFFHTYNLHRPEDLTETLAELLGEAYDFDE
ncbi:DUF5655 domain-containing protein [Euzebya tangerina]|nr:DUF5655 domain-containing protein [Euzebya tangerina]